MLIHSFKLLDFEFFLALKIYCIVSNGVELNQSRTEIHKFTFKYVHKFRI